MDGFMLRDEAARDRVRQAEEFLDPRAHPLNRKPETLGSTADCRLQMTKMCEAIGPILS